MKRQNYFSAQKTNLVELVSAKPITICKHHITNNY